MPSRNRPFCLTTLLFLLGCNHLFYYPDQRDIGNPSDFGQSKIDLQIPSTDGLKLAAWAFAAKSQTAKGVVLHFHGNAENMTTHFLYSSWLADAGYNVITFDYRGYGHSEGSASRTGLFDDGIAAIRWTRERYPNLPLIVFAQSIGGAVAVPAIVESHVPVAAVVLESTFASYRKLARQKLGSFFLTWPLQYPLSYLVSEDPSPRDYAAALQMPVLMVHGTEDNVVPIDNGRELYEGLGTATKEFWPVEGYGHTPAFGRAKSPYRARLVEYLNRTPKKRQ